MGERWRKIEERWETEHNREQDDDGITLAQFSPAGRAGLTLATDFFDNTSPLLVFLELCTAAAAASSLRCRH